MTLQAYLEKLRNKKEHEKKRFAFWTSFGFTAVVFAFWLASFTSGNNNSSVVASVVKNTDTPAQSLVASVGSFFSDVVGYFFTPKTIEYSKIEVVAGDK